MRIAIRAHETASRVVRKVADGVGKTFSRMAAKVRALVDFGAKLGTVFQTWGSWALDLGRKIAGVVTETSDLLSKVSDLSTKTGVSTDTLQELAYAAGQTGVETEALYKGVEAMSRKFGEMAAGGRELSTFLLTVGGPAFLKQAKAAKTNEERLDLMLVALGKIEGEEKRAAFATKVFGKAGEDMVLMLSQGQEGLQALRAEAHAFGVVQGPEAVAAAEEFGDEMAKVEAAWSGAKHTFGAEVMRQLLPHLKEMTAWIAKNPAKIREIATELGGGVARAVVGIRDAIAWIVDHRDDIAKWLPGLAVGFGAVVAALNPIVGILASAVAHLELIDTLLNPLKKLFPGGKDEPALEGQMGSPEWTANVQKRFGYENKTPAERARYDDAWAAAGDADAMRRQMLRLVSEAPDGSQNDWSRGMSVEPTLSVMPSQSVEVDVTLNIRDPGANAVVESVKSSGPVNVRPTKTGKRTAGTRSFR